MKQKKKNITVGLLNDVIEQEFYMDVMNMIRRLILLLKNSFRIKSGNCIGMRFLLCFQN